jgi:hypothetical protein
VKRGVSIPDDPSEFFERFLPERFGDDESGPAEDSAGAAAFEVVGAGVWAFRVRSGALAIERGKPADTRIQIALSPEDFHAVFVERARREAAAGGFSDASRDAFRPLFGGARRAAPPAGAAATLTFRLDHDGTHRRLHVTPGAGDRTTPRTTVMLSLDDFLALVGGRAGVAMLTLRGRIGLRGDLAYATKLARLLSTR